MEKNKLENQGEINNQNQTGKKKKKKTKNQKNTSGKLKIGDIIYLDYQTNLLSSNKHKKGVVVGDGVASEELYCVPKNIVCRNNANINFSKSLFQIEKSKKYSAMKDLK